MINIKNENKLLKNETVDREIEENFRIKLQWQHLTC